MKIYTYVFLVSMVGGMFGLIDAQHSVSNLGQTMKAHAELADRAI
jgi:hypothetical protein